MSLEVPFRLTIIHLSPTSAGPLTITCLTTVAQLSISGGVGGGEGGLLDGA